MGNKTLFPNLGDIDSQRMTLSVVRTYGKVRD